jgi:predicted LPLAT superfamily acyltransferase
VQLERSNRQASLNAIIQRFADRLAHYTQDAPYNWFNFYDFWQTHAPPPAAGDTRRAGDALERQPD